MKRVCPRTTGTDERHADLPERKKEFRKPPFIKHVDVSPGRIAAAARLAGGAPEASILPVRRPNYDVGFGDATQLTARLFQSMAGNVFQDFRAQDHVESVAGQFQARDITFNAGDPVVRDRGLLQIERGDRGEILGQQAREIAVARADVKNRIMPLGYDVHQITNAFLLQRRVAISLHLNLAHRASANRLYASGRMTVIDIVCTLALNLHAAPPLPGGGGPFEAASQPPA